MNQKLSKRSYLTYYISITNSYTKICTFKILYYNYYNQFYNDVFNEFDADVKICTIQTTKTKFIVAVNYDCKLKKKLFYINYTGIFKRFIIF